jgi:four helix bundle protein
VIIIQNFEDLNVWRKSHGLVLEIYKITNRLPREEMYGLTSQMRRSVISVAANIAEGFKRKGKRDKVNFYNISQSSLTELQYYLILVKDLEYLDSPSLNKIKLIIEEVGKMLNGLISSINSSPNP